MAGKNHSDKSHSYIKKAALVGGAAATATVLTMGVSVPSVNAASFGGSSVQLVDAAGTVNPKAVTAALLQVLQAYADGRPPAQLPAELTSLFPGLATLGPAVLSALGTQENVDYLKSLDFSSLLAQMGLSVPSLNEIVPIPRTFSFGGQTFDLPVNLITTGPPFGVLGLLGANPSWVPAFPDAIARAINGTPYSSIDTTVDVPVTVDNPVYQQMYDVAYNGAYWVAYTPVYASTLNQLAQQASAPVWQPTYNQTYANLTRWCGRFCSSSVKNAAAAAARTAADAAVAAAYASALQNSTYQAQADAAGDAAGAAAGLAAVQNIPQNVDLTVTAPIHLDNYRIPIVAGFGLGALAAGMAYPQVVDDLKNQPGGTAPGAAAGSSLTLLPMLLLRNPGRANGGLAARFAPYFGLIGLNTVTPDVQVEQDGNAVLVPMKVDATVEYDPLSDFPAWQNPFALANSGAALLFPTYILRGTAIDPANLGGTVSPMLNPLLNTALGNVLSAAIGDGQTLDVSTKLFGYDVTFPVTLSRQQILDVVQGQLPDGIVIPEQGYQALNQYLTMPSTALPLLEPFRLPVDALNIATGGNFSNPFADAIEPALRILVNLGYTDVDQANGYQRTLDQAGLGANSGGVPFGTLPTGVDWSQVPGDVLAALALGVEDQFLSGGMPGVNDPAHPQPNPLATLMSLLGLPTSPQDLQQTVTGAAPALPSAASLPGADAVQTVTMSTHAVQAAIPQPTTTTITTSPTAAPSPSSLTSSDVRPLSGSGLASVGTRPVSGAISGTQSQLKTAVSGVGTALKSVTDSVTSALKGGGSGSTAPGSGSPTTGK